MDSDAFRRKIAKSFNKSELKTLCFDLGIDDEDLSSKSGTKDELVVELIRFLERRGRVEELVAELRKRRPNKQWEKPLTARQQGVEYSESVFQKKPVRFYGRPEGGVPKQWASREKDLEKLASMIIDNAHRIIAITAMGGAGKSTLIYRLLTEHNKGEIDLKIDGALFYTFHHVRPNISDFFTKACRYVFDDDYANYSSERKKDELSYELGRKRIVIVLDDYGTEDDPILNEFLRSLCFEQKSSQVIITSRSAPGTFNAMKGFEEIPMGNLTSEAAFNFMKDQGIIGNRAQISSVCSYYDNHVLTLTLLVAYLKKYHAGKIAGFHELSGKLPKGVSGEEILKSLLDYYWQILSDRERFFLTRLAAFQSMDITADAFEVMSIDGTETSFNAAIYELMEMDLLNENSDEKKVYSTHNIIKIDTYGRMDKAERRRAHQEIIDYVRRLGFSDVPRERNDLAPLEELFLQHIALKEWEDAISLFVKKPNKLGSRLYDWGYYYDSLEYLKKVMPPKAPENGWVLARVGQIYRKLGKSHEAEENFEQAISIDEQRSDYVAVQLHTIWRAYNLAYMGKNEPAAKMLADGFRQKKEWTNVKDEPMRLGWLGTFYGNLGQTTEALAEFNRSVQLAQMQSNNRHHCHSLIRRGDLFIRLQEPTNAYNDYEKAFSIAAEQQQRDFLADSLRGLGNYHKVMSNWDQSKAKYDEALAITSEISNRYVETQIFVAQARLYESMGNFSKAKTMAEAAIKIARKSMYRAEELQARMVLIRITNHWSNLKLAQENVAEGRKLVRETDHYWAHQEWAKLMEIMGK